MEKSVIFTYGFDRGPWLGIMCRLRHTLVGIGSGLAWNLDDRILMTFEMGQPVFDYPYNQGMAEHIKLIYHRAYPANLAHGAGLIFGTTNNRFS